MVTGGLAGWGSARRGRPAVEGRGDAVEVWRVQVGLDELSPLRVEVRTLIEEHQRPQALPGQADVGDRGHGRIDDA